MSNDSQNNVNKFEQYLSHCMQSKKLLPIAIALLVLSLCFMGGAFYVATHANGTAIPPTATSTPAADDNSDANTDNSQTGTGNQDADNSYEKVPEDDDYTSSDIDTEQYADTVLHETDDAGEEYIENTLFLGDSNTYRYMNYGFADLTNAVGVIGMGVTDISWLGCVNFSGYSQMVTVPKAIPILQPQRVVFGYGTNNLGGDVTSYISTYEKAIQSCYDAYPYFDIIVSAIPPVDVNRSYPNVTMQQIDSFNAALVDMCEENGWKFLNTSEVLKDATTGFAKTEYTVNDGLHLSLEGCTVLFDYIRTHAYETEDTRPKPLKSIPTRGETPPDLIVKDPLKDDTTTTVVSTTVDVYFAATTGGSIVGTAEQKIDKGATTQAVTAVASSDDYLFVNWTSGYTGISDEGASTITYTAPSDINAVAGVVVTANFIKVYPVLFTLTGETDGATLADTKVIVYYSGGEAVTTLTLKEGYTATLSSGTLNGSTLTVSNVTGITPVTIQIKKAPVATATPSPTPTATPIPSATAAPAATATPTPTATTAPVATPTPAPAVTATPAPTAPPATVAPTAVPATPVPATPAPTAVPAPTAPPATPAPTEVPVVATEVPATPTEVPAAPQTPSEGDAPAAE